MREKQQGLFIGIVLTLICFCAIGATVYKTLVGTGSPVNNSIVVWDGVNGNKVRYSAITINSSNDISGVNILNVGSFVLSTPVTQPYGGTGGTNPETAQVALMLRPGLDIQTQNSSLQMIATIPLASGNFIYYDGSNLTNIASTATGRSLLNAANATTALGVVGGVAKAGDTMSGNLFGPYVAYSSTMTNDSNAGLYLTAKAIAEKIESMIVGAFISSIDPTDLEVDETGKLSITNTVGTGRLVKESTLGGTNGSFSSLTDVALSNPYAGQLPIFRDETNLVNGSLMDTMHSEENVYVPILGSSTTALQPFGATALNGGANGVVAAFNGRIGVWFGNSASSGALWSGTTLWLGSSSSPMGLTNRYKFDCEFLMANTNGVNVRLGFFDVNSTNLPTDALHLTITNFTAYLEAGAGGTFTLGTVPYNLDTNIWYRLIIKGTNQTAVANLYTNNVSAWADTVTGANVPTAAASQYLSAGASTYITSDASTNKSLIFVNQIGLNYSNGF
jgi:hypothetical protein